MTRDERKATVQEQVCLRMVARLDEQYWVGWLASEMEAGKSIEEVVSTLSPEQVLAACQSLQRTGVWLERASRSFAGVMQAVITEVQRQYPIGKEREAHQKESFLHEGVQ